MAIRNRAFLQLCKEYDREHSGPAGWFVSEKLDGIRFFWDGGITRGMSIYDIPFANTAKETSNRAEGSGNERVSTGLWSRYGKPIHCPTTIINQLMAVGVPLDGEMWTGRKGWQETTSIVKKFAEGFASAKEHEDSWNKVKMCIFDVPPYSAVFTEGLINDVNYKCNMGQDILQWVMKRVEECRGGCNPLIKYGLPYTFITVQGWLNKLVSKDGSDESDPYHICKDLKNVVLLKQERLPFNTENAKERIDELLEKVTLSGGEGLVVRDPNSMWTPRRNEWILKIKKLKDAEATVMGYKWGLGKYHSLMGAVTLRFDNNEVPVYFDLSGFTDQERMLFDQKTGVYIDYNDPRIEGGKTIADEHIINKRFPIGSKITFTYRELTTDGMPKEARYLRMGCSAT